MKNSNLKSGLEDFDNQVKMIPKLLLDNIKADNLESSKTDVPIIGISAIESGMLSGNSSLIYPSNKFWYDLDALNVDVFTVFQTDNGTVIRPKIEGIFKIEFYTTPYALEDSSFAIWILKQPGNYVLSYSTYNLLKYESFGIQMSRNVKLKDYESIYVAIRQFNDSGKLRAWIGTNNADESKDYSGLYVRKL